MSLIMGSTNLAVITKNLWNHRFGNPKIGESLELVMTTMGATLFLQLQEHLMYIDIQTYGALFFRGFAIGTMNFDTGALGF